MEWEKKGKRRQMGRQQQKRTEKLINLQIYVSATALNINKYLNNQNKRQIPSHWNFLKNCQQDYRKTEGKRLQKDTLSKH